MPSRSTRPRAGSIQATQSYCDVGLDRNAVATIVRVAGEVDLFAAPIFASALEQALEIAAPVIVDLSDCSFFESSGLNALLSADLDPDRSAPIHVVRPPASCADRVLSLTVPGHFVEHDSRGTALAAVAS